MDDTWVIQDYYPYVFIIFSMKRRSKDKDDTSLEGM